MTNEKALANLIKDFFTKSYVKCKLSHTNGYRYYGSEATILVEEDSLAGFPLAHEIGHFLLAPQERLLKKSDYGYETEYFGEKWPDLDNELKVQAIEYILAKKYKYYMPDKKPYVLLHLKGYGNYRRFHHLSGAKMKAKVEKRFHLWVKHFSRDSWIMDEWKKRNTYLKRKGFSGL